MSVKAIVVKKDQRTKAGALDSKAKFNSKMHSMWPYLGSKKMAIFGYKQNYANLCKKQPAPSRPSLLTPAPMAPNYSNLNKPRPV